jgi:proline utilization trans-activator
MDGEHIFSAAIVLVMVCIAFPCTTHDTAAMDSGLDLLHRIADRGNNHIGARYQLLVHLRSAISIISNASSGPLLPVHDRDSHNNATLEITSPVETTAMSLPPNVREGMLVFPLVDNTVLGRIVDELNAGDLGDLGDFRLWEEGYMNSDLSMEYDITSNIS